ncbi:MAG TPA: hypothetical protein VNA13_01615 [Xanthomonadales bacterium]|nr:hypothetical protein [Xanthomonadales bacterium]
MERCIPTRAVAEQLKKVRDFIDNRTIKKIDKMSRRRGVKEHSLADNRKLTIEKAFMEKAREWDSGPIVRVLKKVRTGSVNRVEERQKNEGSL